MTWFTSLLVFLLSRRPDVNVAVTYLESDWSEDMNAVDFLEWCYDLDPTLHQHRPFYGEDSAQR